MKLLKILLCGLLMTLPVFAEESEDRQTATSLRYVSHELDTRQDKLSTGTNAAVTYTNTAGNVTQRTVKSDLNGGSTTDTSLPMVNAVNAGLNTKQDDIDPINDHTAVTYTGQTGTIGAKGIYQDSGTYAEQTDNLIDAKTFNAALKNGLDNEFVCADRPDAHAPGTDICWLWEIHNVTTDNTILPTGYIPLEYLESTGTQYIDTGIVTNENLSFEIKFDPTVVNSTYQTLLACRISAQDNAISQAYTTGGTYADFGNNSEANLTGDLNSAASPTVGVWNVLKQDKIQLSMNGHIQPYKDGYDTNFTAFGNLYLFARNNINSAGVTQNVGNYARAKMAYCRIWNNGTIVRDFVPAIRNSDNKVGMYDTVSGTFFTNAATSGPDFTAGPTVNNNVYLPQNQQ